MKKNSHIFSLIKTLTMSEKRYFKIFSERHTIGDQNKYVVLFDILDHLTQEDDEAIARQLKQARINGSYLSADKNYLYNLVLKSLNDFHDSKTDNLRIKEALLSIEILFHKGLYKECLKLIEKTEVLANDCESFQLMIDLLIWKKKCSGYSLGLKKAAEANSAIDTYVELLNNLKRITNLYYESYFMQANHENLPKSDVIRQFKALLKHHELISEKNALSFSARIYFHLIYANFYQLSGQKEKELDHLQKLTDVLNASRNYAIENPLDYISIYNRLLNIKKHFADSRFFEDIKVLEAFGEKKHIRREVIQQRIFVYANTHELEFYLIHNDFQMALHKIRLIEKNMQSLTLNIEPYYMIYFYYIHAVILVYVGQFHKALKFINNILNEFRSEDRPQVYARVEILNIIAHYELQNHALAGSLCKQVLRQNQKSKLLIPKEEMLLKALSEICALRHFTVKDETRILSGLLEQEAGQKVKKTPNVLIDNYDKWIFSKLKRKTAAELFRPQTI